MTSPVDIATRGYLDSPLSVAADGYLTVTVNLFPEGRGRPDTDTGGKHEVRKVPRPTWRDVELERDDSEIVELVTILFMTDIL